MARLVEVRGGVLHRIRFSGEGVGNPYPIGCCLWGIVYGWPDVEWSRIGTERVQNGQYRPCCGYQNSFSPQHTFILDGNKKQLAADYLLAFDLGPIAKWGLECTATHIPVTPSSCETTHLSIYAIGDVATYPRKNKADLARFWRGCYGSTYHLSACVPQYGPKLSPIIWAMRRQ
ncbi:Ferredoxin--NADP reductase [Entomobacter blattae]|uniref:Ferredoxin--NADP reductase n=1 Tax=Entomobacter blattae TaxID=2762277 RepID=A0A7H1NR03_9PROT|nr:Ferredoxin--NADP reductase [Entomobacter blattae]